MNSSLWRKRRVAVVIPALVLSLSAALPLSVNAFAQGGTAKPPPGAIAPFVTATLPDPVISAADAALIHGFDDTGFIQSATVDASNANCPNTTDPDRFGGTLTLNNGPIVIPCNSVIQLPANTMTWADFIHNGPSTALGSGYPSFEMHAIGNIVGDKRIAGLLYTSQQSLNTSTGVITGIDYATGDLKVDTGDPAAPAIVQINDPNGRFGRAQTPDGRFSVDDANPTIHAATGYPMCVPRTDPTAAGGDDPLCPQANRPNLVPVTVNGASVPAAANGCRNFSVAGIAPPVSGELTRPAAGQAYCSQYVMDSVAARAAGDPDPRQQAPFEVGDSITFSGTLIPATATAAGYTSAHTVEANVGIYTMPGTQPSYLAIGEFGVGTADPNALSINGFATETQDRIFLESETTDVKTAVDIYMLDVNPLTGTVRNRWATPFEMTGEQNGPVQADGLTPIGGGITTQNAGPQPQRARLRATKAPVGLLSQPTRSIRVAVRSLCPPQAPVNDAAGNPVLTALDTCLNKNDATNQVANGLEAGQYFAPTFEFIFPENVKTGDTLVPFDFWHLPFLRYGEGSATQSAIGPAVGPLEPTPWGGPSATVPDAPVIGAATAGNTTATVSWTPPVSDGGAALSGYSVRMVDAANAQVGAVRSAAAGATSLTLTGLANGTAVGFQVQAINVVGASAFSARSNMVTPGATVPGSPVIGSATAADASALVTWAAPASDGGSPLTGFSVQVLDAAGIQIASQSAPAGATSLNVTGLANGTPVSFQVQATNAVGAGPFSASTAAVTPAPVLVGAGFIGKAPTRVLDTRIGTGAPAAKLGAAGTLTLSVPGLPA
ncbi:MAG: fibronectin type III domain-containing protein, partial [Actinomycetota bacterium]